ncbi:hypothetical protein [Aquipuribacter nitratireducens]|uniref:DUF4439 domain-containing protein n=1 Tax=Aquipuribacter nitratireducens TaxID=650104 RepID=A0ABW0GKW8_9MICO
MPDVLPGPPDRRSVLRAGARGLVAGLGALATGGLAACSGDVGSPGEVLRDLGLRGEAGPPAPSARELRRRDLVTGTRACLDALDALAAAGTTTLAGRWAGGGAATEALRGVHREHLALLDPAVAAPGAERTSPSPGPSTAATGAPTPAAGPSTPPVTPTEAPDVLAVQAAEATSAAVAERADVDADTDLAVVLARVGAARAAQAGAVGDDLGPPGSGWPTAAVPDSAREPLVATLQHLLAQEHRARWSYAVVQSWSTDRADAAAAARGAHTAAVAELLLAVELLGAVPVAPEATYPTDLDGDPVGGPADATALALRLQDALATAAGAVLVAAVDSGVADWVAAAVRALALAERGRWSWGGGPVAFPG